MPKPFVEPHTLDRDLIEFFMPTTLDNGSIESLEEGHQPDSPSGTQSTYIKSNKHGIYCCINCGVVRSLHAFQEMKEPGLGPKE